MSEHQTFWDRNRESGGYLLKKRVGSACYSVVRALLMIGLCFLIIQPLLSKISVSFMQEKDLYDTTVVVLPRNLTTSNYKLVASLMGYTTALLNTLWVSLLVSVLQVASCTLVGYGFARFEFPLKKLWFAFVVLVIVIPPQTISTSLYLNFRFFDIFGIFTAITGAPLNLRSSLAPYALMSATCMGLKNGLYIYMLRQYFRGVPKSLEEAAYVDGCGMFHTFRKILLPDATPILTSCFLFSYVWQWTDRFYTRNFLSGTKLLSSQVSILGDAFSKYISNSSNNTQTASVAYVQQIVSTGVIMVVVPLLILYVFAQRGFVESLSQTGIKM